MVSFITVPAAIGLILLREPIIQVLFQHGQFGSRSTALTAHALLYYSLGLLRLRRDQADYANVAYSTQDTMTPARVGAYALGMNIVLNSLFLLLFFRVLSNGSPALASSLTAYFTFGFLFFIFRRRHGSTGGVRPGGITGKNLDLRHGHGRSFVRGVAALAFFVAARHLLEQAGLLVGMILVSAATYFGLARLLRCEELSDFFLLLRRGKPQTLPLAGSGA